MKRAVHFGAGNIGRGFIGNLLSQAEYHVVFADIDRTVIPALTERGAYVVEEVGEDRHEVTVSPVSGRFSDDPELPDEIARADLITTAVGPSVLEIIAPVIATGIARRRERGVGEPLNVIACENMIRASSALATAVREACRPEDREYCDRMVGFPDSAVDRIVPPMDGNRDDPLRVRVEQFSEWIVDQTRFRGPIPAIPGMVLTDQLDAYVERKLFTLNTGHAVAAYLGAAWGHETIGEAIADPRVEAVVRGAMIESGEVLINRYGFERQQHTAYIETVLERFRNPWVRDDVRRVGRQPARKLGTEERLVRPVRGAREYGTATDCLTIGIAAALAFRNPADPEAAAIEETIESAGIDAAIREYANLGDGTGGDCSLQTAIRTAYRMLTAGGTPRAVGA